MSDANLPHDADDDSLANQPLQPVAQDTRGLGIAGVCTIFVATAGLVWFLGVSTFRSLGSTSSSKLIWQQQQAEMHAAELAAQGRNKTEQAGEHE